MNGIIVPVLIWLFLNVIHFNPPALGWTEVQIDFDDDLLVGLGWPVHPDSEQDQQLSRTAAATPGNTNLLNPLHLSFTTRYS